ncbi:MAG: hypothetical protein HND46_21910 [Chloroflexi bacterium]|nr:hypothetical protein [Chloroflexota bacterium]
MLPLQKPIASLSMQTTPQTATNPAQRQYHAKMEQGHAPIYGYQFHQHVLQQSHPMQVNNIGYKGQV